MLEDALQTQKDEINSYLVNNDEKQAIGQDGPDEDVSEDTGNERLRVRHHDSSVPVNRDERPRQRSGDNGQVDEPGVSRVAEVAGGQVDEVENDE